MQLCLFYIFSFLVKKNNLVLSTEHGPAGGDEINLIQQNSTKIPNYGWPISSYGEHYGADEGTSEKYKKNPGLATEIY